MELEGVEGVEGKLKVWIRRVWTLEMVRIRPFLFFITNSIYSPIRGSHLFIKDHHLLTPPDETECHWTPLISKPRYGWRTRFENKALY